MVRPLCPRHIAHRPPANYFKPAGIPLCELQEIELPADEMGALRLADVEDLYHTEAAKRMKVSRQTFDRIVRRAVVDAAVGVGGELRALVLRDGQLTVHILDGIVRRATSLQLTADARLASGEVPA